MIKIIIEVEEDYLREKTDVEKMSTESLSPTGMLHAIANLLGFQYIKKKAEEGETELTVRRGDFPENRVEMYDNNVGDVCLMAAWSEKKEN